MIGTVKFIAGKAFETKRGTRTNVVVALDNGTEAKIWGNLNDPIVNLKKGQRVRVGVKPDGDYELLEVLSNSN